MALNPKHQGLQKVVEEADKPWKKKKKKKKKRGGKKEKRRFALGGKRRAERFAVEGLPGEPVSAPRNKSSQYI